MPTYGYRASDKRGKEIRGLIEADNEELVVERLRGMGYYPLEVKQRQTPPEPLNLTNLLGFKQLGKRLTPGGAKDVPEERRTFSLPEQAASPAADSKPAPRRAAQHRLLEAEPAWKTALRSLFGKGGVPTRALGLAVDADRVRLAELELSDRGVWRGPVSSAPIQTTPNAPPEERKAAAVVAVRRVMQQNTWSAREAVCCFPQESAWAGRLRLPEASPQRLERIVRFEAGECLPSSSRFVFLYDLLVRSAPGELALVLVAVPEEPYQESLRLLQSIRLAPAGIAVASLEAMEESDLRVLTLRRRTKTARFVLVPSSGL